MDKCLDGELGYSCCDVLKLVKTYVPNGEKKEATFSQSFCLASLVLALLTLDEENAKNQINDILKYHRHFVDDIGNLTTACILTLNQEIHEIKNIHIRTKLEMFARLAAYTKNPLEPIMKLLIQPTKYKNTVSDLIAAICRGDHVAVKMDLYELEDKILKEG